MTETVLSPMNLVLLVGIFIGLPVLFLLMMPRGSQIRTVDPALLADPVSPVLARGVEMTPAKRLENSRLILAIVVIFGGFFIVDRLLTQRFAVDFNTMTRADAGDGPAWPTIFPYPCVQRGDASGGSDHAPVPVLWRHHGYHDGFWPSHTDLELVRLGLERRNVAVLHVMWPECSVSVWVNTMLLSEDVWIRPVARIGALAMVELDPKQCSRLLARMVRQRRHGRQRADTALTEDYSAG